MATPPPRLAMVAGEASGDLLASLLIAGLRERAAQLAPRLGYSLDGLIDVMRPAS